jgi:hypothetical protein
MLYLAHQACKVPIHQINLSAISAKSSSLFLAQFSLILVPAVLPAAAAGGSLKNSAGKYVVKNRLVSNVEAMVQDFGIIGTGIVKEVECNISVA